MTTKAEKARRMEDAREFLRGQLKPGDAVHTQVKHVSRSGMMRVIAVYLVRNGDVFDISRFTADAIGAPFDENRWGVKMGGAGMDMTFYVVYSLSRALWPDGYPCTGSNGHTPTGRKSKANRCPSNDHFNGDRVYRKGKMHSDGGYALTRIHL